MTAKYEHIATITLDSSASSVTFSSIPQGYRDLELVFDGTGGGVYELVLNSDTTSGIYTGIYAVGNGSSGLSGTNSSDALRLVGLTGNQEQFITNLMDYSATDKHTTTLSRTNRPSTEVGMWAHRYASTAAITTLKAQSDGSSFSAGTTLDLYGIVGGA